MSTADTDSERLELADSMPAPKRRRGWVRFLLYLVIFVSGSIVGVGMTLIVIRNLAVHAVHHPDEMPARVASRMANVLSLRQEQRVEVERILRERQDALQELRREFQPEIDRELDRLDEQVSEVLDDDQRTDWKTRFAQLRETWVPRLPPAP